MYTFETRVRFSEVGAEGRMDSVAVLNAFQDCSTFQSEDLGIGDSFMQAQGMAWLIVYWNLHVYRYPSLGEKIRVGTSPYALKGFVGYRNFMLETPEGERLAEADSVWPLIDRKTQNPVRILPVMKEKYALEERFPMEETRRKIKLPIKAEELRAAVTTAEQAQEGAAAAAPFTRKKSDGAPPPEIRVFPPITVDAYRLDTNGHMNNAQYLRIAGTVSPVVRQARRLRIEYRKQAYEGDVIVPVLYQGQLGQVERQKQTEQFVLLCDREGDPYALVSVEEVFPGKEKREG